MRKNHGFTVIELLLLIVVLGTLAMIFIIQKNNLDATTRDDKRKIAINAMYYNLEKVYYEKHGSYPAKIDSKTITAMDPKLFKDPDGVELGKSDSNYRYIPANCTDNACKIYTLRSTLEHEADYVKHSLHD